MLAALVVDPAAAQFLGTDFTSGNASGATADPTSAAIGTNANASGFESMAVGPNAVASGFASLAVGHGTNASHERSIAVGHGANASGQSTLAVGGEATASGTFSSAVGRNATASGLNSTAPAIPPWPVTSNRLRWGIRPQRRPRRARRSGSPLQQTAPFQPLLAITRTPLLTPVRRSGVGLWPAG